MSDGNSKGFGMHDYFDLEIPEGGFKVIHMDVPWNFKAFTKKGLDGRPQHYKRMSLADIKKMPVRDLAAKNCHLFFWTSSPYLEQAFAVIKALGFKYSSIGFTWVKLYPKEADSLFMVDDSFCLGQGYTTRKNTEICLIAKIGHPKRISKAVRELLIAVRREHSRKPDEVYRRIEAFADGPYIDLFAREPRKNWTVWGNETTKFE